MKKKIEFEFLQNVSMVHPIIIYDGVCHLCDGSVRWIIKRDSNEIFKFLPQQFVELTHDLDSIILISKGKKYYRSDAVLKITKLLGGKYSFFSALISTIPKLFVEWAYKKVAKYRFHFFGRSETCILLDEKYYSWLKI